jgi:hypothetical protein
MASISTPALTYTLNDFIKEQQSDDMTYANFSIIRETSYARFTETGLLDYYMPDLKKICIKIPIENVTSEQKVKYKYHPDLLAYDIYGSVQLDFVVLLCNGIIDPKEFDLKCAFLLLPKRSVLSDFLSKVYNSEKTWREISD